MHAAAQILLAGTQQPSPARPFGGAGELRTNVRNVSWAQLLPAGAHPLPFPWCSPALLLCSALLRALLPSALPGQIVCVAVFPVPSASLSSRSLRAAQAEGGAMAGQAPGASWHRDRKRKHHKDPPRPGAPLLWGQAGRAGCAQGNALVHRRWRHLSDSS